MFRYVQLWVPPLTPKDNPATLPIKLCHGRIVRWWVGFPDGCADYVHAVVYHFGHQVLPANEDEDLFWNGYVFEIPDSYDLKEEPFEIELRAWSEDDTNDEYVTLGVAVEPIEEVTIKDLFGVLQDFVKSLMGGAK